MNAKKSLEGQRDLAFDEQPADLMPSNDVPVEVLNDLRETTQRKFAELQRLTFEEYARLVKACTYEEVITCLELVRAKRHPSEFRAKMEQQIRGWLTDPGIHQKPLSPKQFAMTKPKWPIKYTLP